MPLAGWLRSRKLKVTMRSIPAGVLRPTPNDCRVAIEHLKHLDKIHDLLTALNDPYANIGRLVAAIPVLAARCVARAIQRSKIDINSIDHALTLIGNKGLEAELLTLLEDLTVLNAEREI
jgi:hypothetical protein